MSGNESPTLRCKYCGEELVRITGKSYSTSIKKRGVRLYCKTEGCPVIFAIIPRWGNITWILEARLNEDLIA